MKTKKQFLAKCFLETIAIFFTTSIFSQTSINNSFLVGHWTFDQGSGITAVDSSNGGNTGTFINGTAWGTGWNGNGAYFDGTDDYVDAGNGASLNLTTAITISAWVKPIGKGAANYLDVFRKDNLYRLSIREGGIILFYLPGVKNWITDDKNKKKLFDGVWHHIVATYDGINQTIYIDGLFIATTTATGNITPSAITVKIGGAPDYFKGSMDNVQIYNFGVTAAQVKALYLSYADKSKTGPRTYFISSSTGNDNNNGLSQATAWKNIDMIYKQGTLPNGIIPGDSILLKRGDKWEGQMQFSDMNGTANLPITIGAYGSTSNPKPIIYGDGRNLTSNPKWTAVSAYPGVYEANVGLGGSIERVFENNTMYPHSFTDNPYTLASGRWAAKPYGRSDLIWVRTPDGNPPNNTRVFRSAAVTIVNSKNIIIENLDIKEVFRAVTVTTSDSIILRNIDTHNTLDIGMLFTQTNNSIMEKNNLDTSGHTTLYFTYNSSYNIMRNNIISGSYAVVSGITVPPDGDNCAIGLHTGTGNLIERNTIRTNAIDFYYEKDAIIRYNRFTTLGAGTWPHGTNLDIYGNIGGILGNAVNTGTQSIRIFHNVFIGARGVMAGTGGGIGESTGAIIFKNNIVYNSASNINAVTVNFGKVVESDHNCFFNINNNKYKYDGIFYASFSAYQTGSGQDLNSVYGDPKLDVNFNIASNSPCKNMGKDISSFINFPYKDYVGVSIPQCSVPDAGAYEFVSIPVGTILGKASVCKGQTVTYTVPSIANATSYIWTLPIGAIGSSTLNSIAVTYTAATTLGNITVKGQNNQCIGDPTNFSVTVNALPIVSLTASANNVCINSSSFSLTGAPSSGTYSGNGVIGNSFDPSTAGAGTHTVTYNYTDANACSNSTTQNVIVNALPTVSLSTSLNNVCINGSSISLTGAPSSGTYSGNGVNGNAFDPSIAGAGTHTVTYNYTDANTCSNSTTQNVIVNALPIVSLTASANNVCINSSPISLTGAPSSGTYSGNGVNGNAFDPSIAGAGTHTVTYNYTDANTCSNSTTQNVIVNALPTVSLTTSANNVCINSSPISLTGAPSSGTYSGNGVNGNSFDPSIAGAGTHTVTYNYTDANTCSNSTTQNVIVNLCTGINPLGVASNFREISIFPNPSTGKFTLLLPLENCSIEIINELGQLIQERNTKEKTELDVEIDEKGIYFIKVTTNENKVNIKKVVVMD